MDVQSGNLQSLVNALDKLGWKVEWVRTREEAERAVEEAQRMILPGVGNFGHFMDQFLSLGLSEPVQRYIASGKPLFGICVGLQALFQGSDESPRSKGLGLVDDRLSKFSNTGKSVPHIGWTSAGVTEPLFGIIPGEHYYFVHSYACIRDTPLGDGWECGLAQYGDEKFVSALVKNNVFVTQFHPEKSGEAGINVIRAFLDQNRHGQVASTPTIRGVQNMPTKRVIACLDVRANDQGDIVVTKGDQYDVRETQEAGGHVRNLGKPVQVAEKYYSQGADEITFLNITSFRNCPLEDLPMLEILRLTSKNVFVPLTIGGGIRDTLDPKTGVTVPALEIATMYFKSGADKVSIGSDAVYAAERYYADDNKNNNTPYILDPPSPIETISRAYGVQAVVVSIDPKRVYVKDPSQTRHHTIRTTTKGPNGEEYVWYQCTVSGGRESRDMGAYELAQAVEALGCGEILLNCIDKDGTNSGFDLELVRDIKSAVRIPVIASSGAGTPQHFVDVFTKTPVDAALGAGMFHRDEYRVGDVKRALKDAGLEAR